MKQIKLFAFIATVSLALITACGGGGGGGTSGSASSTSSAGSQETMVTGPNFGGIASGLGAGDSVTLNDGGETITVSANGGFMFKQPTLAPEVSIVQQPTSTTRCVVNTQNQNSFSANVLQGKYSITATNLSSAVLLQCGPYPAVTPSFPQVVSLGASPNYDKSPIIIPVYFSDTANQASHTTFLNLLVASNIWNVLKQYGIGAASVGTPVILSTPTPSTFGTAEAEALLNANSSTWAKGDVLASTSVTRQFFVFYTNDTTNTGVANSCGWHTANETFVKNSSGYVVSTILTPFAVVGGCAGDNLDRSAEHEIMEGSADVDGNSGYSHLSVGYNTWTIENTNYDSVEIGDMCETENVVSTDIQGYTIQPIWDNAAATQGKNPCNPSVGSLFFCAVPQFPAKLQEYGTSNYDMGVVIPVGGSVTIPVKVRTYAKSIKTDGLLSS